MTGESGQKLDWTDGRIDTAAVEGFAPFFAEAGAYERHFNEMQSRYRSLASTWLLATFAGIGFVLSKEELGLPFDRFYAGSGLAVAGMLGIVLLWNLDLLVYHRLLDAVFFEALRNELEERGLPKVRVLMMRSQNARGVTPSVVWFYLGASGALGLVALGCLSYAVVDDAGPAMGTAAGAAFFIITCVALGLLWRKTGKRSEVAEQMMHAWPELRQAGSRSSSTG